MGRRNLFQTNPVGFRCRIPDTVPSRGSVALSFRFHESPPAVFRSACNTCLTTIKSNPRIHSHPALLIVDGKGRSSALFFKSILVPSIASRIRMKGRYSSGMGARVGGAGLTVLRTEQCYVECAGSSVTARENLLEGTSMKNSFVGGVGLVLSLTVLPQLACQQQTETEAPRPNVIIVLVDAMRADRLGPYGFTERPTTPTLDRFAAESIVFRNAISQSGWTVPSVASLFSGVYPQTHGVLRFIDPEVHQVGRDGGSGILKMDAMSMDHTTLAEQFSEAGYETAAILKSIVINAGRGFDQGFDWFELLDEGPRERLETGAHLTDAAISWLGGQAEDQPFFLYLHFMDPHTAYIAPEPYYSKYSGAYDSSLDGRHNPVVAFNEKGADPPTLDDVAKLLALYDAEVEYWDSQFLRLIEYLESSGLAENTIVVLTADHGEAFWEHELFGHRAVFQENILVPMILRIPGAAPRVIEPWVEMIDIGPTIVDLVGIDAGPNWIGHSHAEAIRLNQPVTARTVSSEWAGERTLITPEGLKILLGHGAPRLYDLSADPGETENLATKRPNDRRRLKKLLRGHFREAKEFRSRFEPAEPADLSPDQVEALIALGYLEKGSLGPH